MADYGLKILNSDSEIQIDGTYVNYCLRASANSQSIGSSNAWVSHSFSPTTPYPPVVLVKPLANYGIGLTQLNYSSPNYNGFRIGGVANATYSYRVFFPAGTKSSEDYGLRVYNADEDLVFDSGFAPFRIIDVISVTMGSTYSHGATDSKVWYILTPLQMQVEFTWPGPPMPPTPGYGKISGVQRVSSTQVKVDFMNMGQIGNFQADGTTETGTTSNLIVCECDE